MTSEGFGEIFEGDSADTCAEIFSLMSMGGRAEGLACADPGARTPIGVSGNFGLVLMDQWVFKNILFLHQVDFGPPNPPLKYFQKDIFNLIQPSRRKFM